MPCSERTKPRQGILPGFFSIGQGPTHASRTLPPERPPKDAVARDRSDLAWAQVSEETGCWDLANPVNARDLARTAALHPASRELATAGLLFLPGRYLPLGWGATWATRRVLRRYLDPPAVVLDASRFGASRPARNVTLGAPHE